MGVSVLHWNQRSRTGRTNKFRIEHLSEIVRHDNRILEKEF